MGTLRLRLTGNNTVTINIVKMDKDGYVELTYKKMWAANDRQWRCTGFATVTVTSDATRASADASAALGMVLPREGTGTIEITDIGCADQYTQDFNHQIYGSHQN